DEPRWFTEKSAVFSAGLRDIDAILGRDERLVQKLEEAVKFIDAKFAAIIGTPVPAVIGTDFRALGQMAEKRLGIPVLALDTTGIGLYDEGEEKAYVGLFSAFASDKFERKFDVGILGATPLNLPGKNYAGKLKGIIEKKYGKAALFSGENGIDEAENAGGATLNVAVSVSGIKAAEYLQQRFGTPFVVEFPTEEVITKNAMYEVRGARCANTLIIHQQVLANSVRELLEARGETADVAVWFKLHAKYARENDVRLSEEDELLRLLSERRYTKIVADPIFLRCPAVRELEFVPLCHYACSGELCAASALENFSRIIGE
ncbi:MAG: nitrogenase component 1, partial [Synergistaceae bacterium]|nr:nitrogenase component 1 [Synergistaceae bacterium]